MYLQPIFGSPDIQQQMPQGGQQFSRVNRIFLKIMQYTLGHTLVLDATEKPSLLEDLQECNMLLTTIKQRVNDYLEKKRAAFPRYIYTSSNSTLFPSHSWFTVHYDKYVKDLISWNIDYFV